jgi:ribosome biogenesis GTPase A
MTYWEIVKKIVMKADVIIMVMDARMPDLSRNEQLESMVARMNKKLLLAFNKIDLVSEEYLKFLRKRHQHAFFVSGPRNLGINKLRRAIMIAAKREGIENPKVGVVGYPNVGKSAIINALAHRSKALMSSIAGTTKGVQIIKAGSLHVLDSPGVFPYGDDEIKLGILAAKNPDRVKNPELLACEIIKMFLSTKWRGLEDFYGIRVDEEEPDAYEIMLEIGKTRKFLLKGGVIDERRTALQIIRDWQDGRLRI